MPEPAYRRLQVDERRRQLLDRATELFTQQGYDQLSMAQIARGAGISKALLYHYFPSKRDLFEAALAQGAEEHLSRVGATGRRVARREPRPVAGLDRHAPRRVPGAAAQLGHPRGTRADRARARGDGAAPARRARRRRSTPPVRTAVRAWLWYMDGVCLDWVHEGDLDRDAVRGLLLGTLLGALTAAGLDPAALGPLAG